MILMSNNQWKCDRNLWEEIGGDCSAEARVPGLVRAYLEAAPDVLGLQEVSRKQASIMMSLMSKVTLADGTVADYEYVSGGDTPIVYRRDRFKLLESGFFRYSEAVPGYEGSFNNGETKSYAWGVFESRTDKKVFALMSTHLWWKSGNPASKSYQEGSDVAREYQIKLASAELEKVMAKYGCPGIIMGDFNAALGSRCMNALFDAGWQETHDLALGDRDETRGHHFCCKDGYGRKDDGGVFAKAIDHIVIKNQGDAVINHFRRIDPEWFDPLSDHYPLYIDIDF
ncbi:MAG: endonuclease/exonuclease/phosphatase family protein [Clostridia bacterium]|nr:endonuclease/exonuclease/phosphatase family protein [Clostridia bacterium]